MKKIAFLSCFSALFFISCSAPYREAPRAVNYKASEQHKLQAMAHWNIIAKNIAESLTKKINYPVYLKTAHETKFEKILLRMLRDKLINQGIVVKTNKKDVKILTIDASAVKFSPNRDKWNDLQGSLVALGSGVFVASEATGPGFAAVGIVGGEGLYAYSSKYSKTPQYEIDVNIVVTDKNKFLASVNKIYYINDSDIHLYSNNKCAAENCYHISVKGE